MPAIYECDVCKVTADNLDGWYIVSVQFIHEDPNAPKPPGGRMLDSTAPDLLFDKLACREKWCKQADVTDPGPYLAQRMANDAA